MSRRGITLRKLHKLFLRDMNSLEAPPTLLLPKGYQFELRNDIFGWPENDYPVAGGGIVCHLDCVKSNIFFVI